MAMERQNRLPAGAMRDAPTRGVLHRRYIDHGAWGVEGCTQSRSLVVAVDHAVQLQTVPVIYG